MTVIDQGVLTKIRDPEGILPRIVWTLDMPEWDEDISRRNYNAFAKAAVADMLALYHERKEGFEKHFRRDARQRYRHFPRTEKYKRYKAKRFHSTVDLVKTGLSKKRMLSYRRITVGGTAANGDLHGKLTVYFKDSLKGGSGSFRNPDHPAAVTVQKMILELQRFDETDPGRLSKWFAEAFMKRVAEFRKHRKRRRVSGRGTSRRAAAA